MNDLIVFLQGERAVAENHACMWGNRAALRQPDSFREAAEQCRRSWQERAERYAEIERILNEVMQRRAQFQD